MHLPQADGPQPEEAQRAAGRKGGGAIGTAVTIIAVAMSLYHILYVGHVLERFGIHIMLASHRAATLAFLMTLSLLVLRAGKGQPRNRVPWYDLLLIPIAVAGPLYNVFTYETNVDRYALQQFRGYELALAITTVIMVLEIARRALGWPMPFFSALFLAHMFLGNYLPGFLEAPGASLPRAAALLVYSVDGIYGVALGVASTIIVMFIIFGEFLFVTPLGQFFVDLAIGLVGHVRGGPAKVAVIGSAFFGTMSGSPTANVALTGTFTIPMMKKVGYQPEFAAATEAVASTGGNFMPPIMGSIAFLMSEWLGIPYWSIAVAALIPSLLYYTALFIQVDAEACRLGLKGLPRAECPPVGKTFLRGWPALIPLVLLVVFLAVLRYSPEYSVLLALGALVLISIVWKRKWLAPRQFVAALRGGGVSMLPAGNACACAGVMIGAITVTQLGIGMSQLIVRASGGNLMVLLVLTAATCFLLGMIMAGIPAYVMVAVLVAPALTKLGIPPLMAHLFVFYWVMLHFFTPPVAPATYVASGIAQSDPWKTGMLSVRIAVATYIIPFLFVYHPALLLIGSPVELALSIATSLGGIVLLVWGVSGTWLKNANPGQRLLFVVCGGLLMVPNRTVQVIGLLAGGLTVVWLMGREPILARLGRR